MDLSIIIVNYKSKVKLINCLNSICLSDLGNLKYEIIVVDNNSGDNFDDFLSLFPEVKVLISKVNLGMGGGNNIGIDKASGEYILILNPDTIIKDKAIFTLWNYFKNNKGIGVIGPKLLYPDGQLQYSCSRFPRFYMPVLRRTFLGDFFPKLRDDFQMINFNHNLVSEVDWLMGSCLMFKKRISLTSGTFFEPRFDSRYFMYCEDMDFCREILTKNLKVVYNPESIVIHDHARESAKNSWYLAIFLDKLARQHIYSWLKYFIKWSLK